MRIRVSILSLAPVLLLLALLPFCVGKALAEDNMRTWTYLNEDTTIGGMVNHPVLAAFGRHLLPGTREPMDLPLRHVGRLMPGTATCSPRLSLMP